MSLPMKDSGVDWLGKVPADWDVVPATALFTESKERARDGDQMLSATQKYGVIPLADYEQLEQRQVTKANVNLEMRKHVEVGDFVISMRSMDGGLERARATGSVRSSYSVLRAGPNVEGRYFSALLKSSLYIQALRLTSNFIRDGQDLSFTHVKKVRLPKPGLEEQGAIADYLDRETAQIDTLIAKKTRFIELLREKRQALITYAVTKGLNARVPMKDTGVQWFGCIPQNWKLVPFRLAAWFQEGPGIMAVDFKDEGVPLLRVSGVQSEFASLNGCNYLSPEKVTKRWQHFKTELGDLLISASATTGTISEVGDETVGCIPYTGIIRLQNTNRCHKAFLKAFLGSQAFFEQIVQFKSGSTIQHFGPTHLSQMRIALPPVDDQVKIISSLSQATARVDTLITKTKRSIELLREHRIALITAAVTGKIDLRTVA